MEENDFLTRSYFYILIATYINFNDVMTMISNGGPGS